MCLINYLLLSEIYISMGFVLIKYLHTINISVLRQNWYNVCLVEDWKDCLDEDLMLAVSIDLLKASDNLSPNLLLAKLEAYDLYK